MGYKKYCHPDGWMAILYAVKMYSCLIFGFFVDRNLTLEYLFEGNKSLATAQTHLEELVVND